MHSPPDSCLRYPHLLRQESFRRWRPLAGIALFLVVLASGGLAVVMVLSAMSYLLGGEGSTLDVEAVDQPVGLLANNLAIAMAIPASVVAVYVAHAADPRWLTSVVGRLRLGLLWRFCVLAGAVVPVFFGLSFLFPAPETGGSASTATTTVVLLLLVVLVSTPLQAVAEEVACRGYLNQAVASWLARPRPAAVLAAVLISLLFAAAHGTQDGPLFADRLAFGLVTAWLVWRTGGLEAAIALHVVNNLATLGLAVATDTLGSALETSTLDWKYAVLDVSMMVTFAVVADLLARRWRVEVHRAAGAPSALAPSSGVGYPGSSPPVPPPAG